MKRTLIIAALVLIISTSVIAGTLSMYTIRIDDLAKGDVVAKEFKFVGDGMDSFEEGVKIAPTEERNWHFSVSNYEGNVITETDLYYRLTFHVHATDGKSAIEPLVIKVNGETIPTVDGEGTLEVFGTFELLETGQDEDYNVDIYWPNGDDDISYAGRGFGTTVSVDAVARQMPFDWEGPEEPGEDPGGNEGEEPGGDDPEPIDSDILVEYKTGEPWVNNEDDNPQFKWEITITNNSDNEIKNWSIQFTMPDTEIYQYWDAEQDENDSPQDYTYEFHHPNNYNENIPTNEGLVSFGGLAYGPGDIPIKNVTVNGIIAEIECSFGTLE